MNGKSELFSRASTISRAAQDAAQDELASMHRDAGVTSERERLAREVVSLYQGDGAGAAAEARFDRVHRERELPEEIPEVAIPPEVIVEGSVYLPALLALLGLADSNSHARRLIEQGGVRLGGEPVSGDALELPVAELRGRVLQVGRRGFARLG